MSRSDPRARPAARLSTTTPWPIVPWPDEADPSPCLAEAGVPRLLFIAPGHAPPAPLDLYEDWVRVPGQPTRSRCGRPTWPAGGGRAAGSAIRSDRRVSPVD